ncbi:MAGE family-domain-containing protein [Naematelia encephala]|uniref:MAGE family-domain-containing protein n=1 Tax=Naematelia encephala TaxID=71784 RepID=A0A1Y2ANS6_9TREE|nr:MAGE family-domain-containing protein [Naematelia encephala]
MAPRRSVQNGTSQTQTQRRQRPVPVPVPVTSEDEISEHGSAGSSDEASTSRQNGGPRDIETKNRASQLVRLALFFEYRRRALSRMEIVKQVMPSDGRAFNAVFEAAQAVLKSTFGMELYELPKRVDRDRLGRAGAETQTQTQRGKGKGRARNDDGDDEEDDGEEDGDVEPGVTSRSRKAPGSKTYILRSILPRELIAEMSQPRPLPMLSTPNGSDDQPEDSGALIQWEKGDGTPSGHVALMGIRAVILSLVLCYGRSIDDDILHALLRRLDLDRNTLLPYTSPDSKDPPMDLDKYLDLLAKQNYLEKVKSAIPGNRDAEKISWKWGNRDAEFSEKAAAEFIAKIFIDNERDDSSDEEDVPRVTRNGANARSTGDKAATREQKRIKLLADIEKAAGSPLAGTL